MSEPQDKAPATPEETRLRFREALERKQFGHHGREAAGNGPAGAHPHTAPAKPQRTFRRKSG